MTALRPAPPLAVADLMPIERTALIELLRSFTATEWDAPTECPAWTVKGIALHLLGDDLSLLSRQRDSEPSPVVVEPTAGWQGLISALDDFNQQWVARAGFFGTELLAELLSVTGEWTHRWYATVDPESRGEPVHWASPDPAPYWLLAARELLERWIHHHQIRRAVGRPDLADGRLFAAAVATTIRGFPQGFEALPAPDGTTVTIETPGGTWTVAKAEHGGHWSLF